MSGLNRREALILGSAAVAYGLTQTTPAKAIAVGDDDTWARIAAQHFTDLGVELVKNEQDIGPGERLAQGLMQRHVDWLDEIRDGKPVKADIRHVTAALGLLTDNVARSIGPSNRLKTFSMMLPTSGDYNGVRLAYGHLRLRFLQSYYRGDADGFQPEGIINRIDILFPYQGV